MFEFVAPGGEIKLARAKKEAADKGKAEDEATIKEIYTRLGGLVLDKPIEEKLEEVREKVAKEKKAKKKDK
jgi:hypothetical protein